MSLKQEIETWVQAIGQYDSHEFAESLKTFDGISDTSKILFNCGVIHATLGEHDKAVECYQRAIKRDNYLAVAYFQQGVSNFLVGDFEEALANFNDTLLYLRGNRYINYEQLGLKYRLCSCEVLFNRGLCYIYLQQKDAGMSDLTYAAKEKVKEDHDVIDEAIREEAEGYTVFSIPVGVIYRPNSAKVKNLKAKDYLGKARLIAASDQGNPFASSMSAEAKVNAAMVNRSVDDRPLESISFGASNLVKPGLHSRSRQQSEPPVNRNVFPPTPPPEQDSVRPAFVLASSFPPSNPSLTTKGIPVSEQPAKPPRPEPLNLDSINEKESRPRLGTTRTASEPRGPSRRNHNPNEHTSRQRLFMETTPVRPQSNGAEADIDEQFEETHQPLPRSYPKHSSHHSSSDSSQRRPGSRRQNSGRSRSRQRRQHYSIEEEPSEDPGTISTSSSLDEFEILNNAGGGLSRPPPPRARSSSRRGASRSRQAPEMRNMRIKTHFGDDTRYIMLTPDVPLERLVEKIRAKFGMKGTFKLKVRDEGDLITMGDADDWDMAIGSAKKEARAESAEMGKMEVWVHETP